MPVYIETNQLISFANQLTGFYFRATLALNGLKASLKVTPNKICIKKNPFYFKLGKPFSVWKEEKHVLYKFAVFD